jgi:SH3 domain protein
LDWIQATGNIERNKGGTKRSVMKKHSFGSLFLLIFGLLFSPAVCGAAYITDSWDFSFRSGPGNQYRIKAMLPSGQEVEILQRRETWTQIQLPDGRSGWVITRALMNRVPWEVRAKRLENEKQALNERYSNFEENWDNLTARNEELTERYNETAEALETLKAEYEELKRGATNYLELKKDYDIVKSTLAEELEKNDALEQQNKELKSSQNIKWFATGALVLLVGWLIGLVMGRSRKKQRQSLY